MYFSFVPALDTPVFISRDLYMALVSLSQGFPNI